MRCTAVRLRPSLPCPGRRVLGWDAPVPPRNVWEPPQRVHRRTREDGAYDRRYDALGGVRRMRRSRINLRLRTALPCPPHREYGEGSRRARDGHGSQRDLACGGSRRIGRVRWRRGPWEEGRQRLPNLWQACRRHHGAAPPPAPWHPQLASTTFRQLPPDTRRPDPSSYVRVCHPEHFYHILDDGPRKGASGWRSGMQYAPHLPSRTDWRPCMVTRRLPTSARQ